MHVIQEWRRDCSHQRALPIHNGLTLQRTGVTQMTRFFVEFIRNNGFIFFLLPIKNGTVRQREKVYYIRAATKLGRCSRVCVNESN